MARPTSRKVPPPTFERTLNGTGFMIATLDEISHAFVQFAARQIPLPALDIGAAFGVATHAALAQGVRMVSTDIDPRHLEILKQRTPPEHRCRLKTVAGAFPEVPACAGSPFGAILISRVLHFFDGPAVERAAARLFELLSTGGKVFVVVEGSLFLDCPPLRRLYEEQLAAGARWPGFVSGVKKLLPQRAGFVPDQLHYLDPDILSRTFREAGFEVETARLFSRPEDPTQPDAMIRESVGLIARRL